MKTIILKAVMVTSIITGICLIVSFSSCKSPPPPPPEPEPEPVVELPQAPIFTLQDMRVERISKNMVELFISVDLENPNEFELPQPRIAFDYQVFETSVIRSRLRNEGALPASSTTNVIFGIVVYYDDLFYFFPEVKKYRFRDVPSELNLSCDIGIPVMDDELTRLKVAYTLPIQW